MNRRNTSQQRSVRAAIEDAGRPLSINEIADIATDTSPGIGIRTIYRVVKRLLDDHVITTRTTENEIMSNYICEKQFLYHSLL